MIRCAVTLAPTPCTQFFAGDSTTRLLLCMVVHPLLTEAAEAMARSNSSGKGATELRRGNITVQQAQDRVLQSSVFAFSIKQLMALYKRLMLLNMGSDEATLVAIVGAAIEEAITRGFVVELDTFIRRVMRKPELEGEELALQRLVWMCDSSMAAIAEFNAIFTSTFAMILLERHAVLFGIGYVPNQPLNSGVVFVQLMLELSLEMVVDNAAMWAEAEHGVPITQQVGASGRPTRRSVLTSSLWIPATISHAGTFSEPAARSSSLSWRRMRL